MKLKFSKIPDVAKTLELQNDVSTSNTIENIYCQNHADKNDSTSLLGDSHISNLSNCHGMEEAWRMGNGPKQPISIFALNPRATPFIMTPDIRDIRHITKPSLNPLADSFLPINNNAVRHNNFINGTVNGNVNRNANGNVNVGIN